MSNTKIENMSFMYCSDKTCSHNPCKIPKGAILTPVNLDFSIFNDKKKRLSFKKKLYKSFVKYFRE